MHDCQVQRKTIAVFVHALWDEAAAMLMYPNAPMSWVIANTRNQTWFVAMGHGICGPWHLLLDCPNPSSSWDGESYKWEFVFV